MQSFDAIIQDITVHWYVYLSMPVIAAAIGYTTKVVAVRMMFYPLEFRGIRPFFGWQGIVPRNAERMTVIACDTMTSRLISPQEIFSRLDPVRLAGEIEKPMLESAEKIIHEVMVQYQPDLWNFLPDTLRSLLIRRFQADAPAVIHKIMTNIRENITHVFDLRDMVVTSLLKDKQLLNSIFLEAGSNEFQFIIRSGIYFGTVIGLIQMTAWVFSHNALIMPVFGLFTGWFTDWLALKMIFNPKKPTTYLGLFTWQGLFLKRRREVAASYGDLVAQKILTPEAIIDSVLKGPLSDNLFELIQVHIKKLLDEQAGFLQPVVEFTMGSDRYNEMKRSVVEKVMKELPDTLKHVHKYAGDAMDIRNTLVNKMQQLTEEEFEKLLRPPFQQDEWILITVGAILGFLVGELQILLMHIFNII